MDFEVIFSYMPLYIEAFLLTIKIGWIGIAISIGIGIVLAFVLHFKIPFVSQIAKIYVEVFRNTPLLLWIFICVVFCPVPSIFAHKLFGLSTVETKLLFKASIALILFTSSVIAEIIRGGLNSIPVGQFEAGYSQGFNVVQVMVYIILPQAIRNVVPTLLSQIITTIKDSSYLANVAAVELMARVRQVLSSANIYNGLGTINVSDVFVLFGVTCLIYFIINFTLSCVVRSIRKKETKVTVARS